MIVEALWSDCGVIVLNGLSSIPCFVWEWNQKGGLEKRRRKEEED